MQIIYTDKQRIEDCLIPALFEGIAHSHIRQEPECKESYQEMLNILKEIIDSYFKGVPPEKIGKLGRRLDRITNKINRYFIKENFNTRKSFLALSEWARALLEAGALAIDPESQYWILLEDMGKVILVNGYGEIPNFEKIDASAIKHVPVIHKLAQEEGYFN